MVRLGRWLRALAISAAAACTPSAELMVLPPPNVVGAGTLLIALESGDSFDFVALRAGGQSRTHLSMLQTDLMIFAVAYPATLEELGLSEGPVIPVRPGADGQTLGEASAMFRMQLAVDGSMEWDEVDRVPDEVHALRVPPTLPCLQFRAPVVHEIPGTFVFSIQLDDAHLLVKTRRATPPLLVNTTTEEITALQTRQIDVATAAALVGDQLFVGDDQGRLYRGTLPAPPESIETIEFTRMPWTVLDGIDGMTAGMRSNGEPEVFIAGGSLTYLRGDESPSTVAFAREHEGRMAWSREGVAMLATTDTGGLLRLTPTSTEDANVEANSGFLSLAFTPDLGIVAGTLDGEFFVEDETAFRILTARYGWWALGVAPAPNGFAFALASGQIGQFRQRVGFCETISALPVLVDGDLAVLPAAVVVAGQPDSVAMTRIAIMRVL